MNAVSAGFRPGPPPVCPQMVEMTRSSAFGIMDTSMRLSSGGKYWSVSDGITNAFALIDAQCLLEIAVVEWVVADVARLPRRHHRQDVVGIILQVSTLPTT